MKEKQTKNKKFTKWEQQLQTKSASLLLQSKAERLF